MNDVGPLNDAHWRVIGFLRDYHASFGALPTMRRVCRACGLNRDAVKLLFGGCRIAWQVAGLPYPGAEALAYMD